MAHPTGKRQTPRFQTITTPPGTTKSRGGVDGSGYEGLCKEVAFELSPE